MVGTSRSSGWGGGGAGTVPEQAPFEPTSEQARRVERDLRSIGAAVERHLTDHFGVSTSVTRTDYGPQGIVAVTLPNGYQVHSSIPISADLFEDETVRSDGGAETEVLPPDLVHDTAIELTSRTLHSWSQQSGLQNNPNAFAAH